MTAGRGLIAVILVGFVVSPAASAFRRIDQQFRTGVDLTTFAVTVTDRKGNIVTDLAKEDFEIVEDGKTQALQYFAHGAGETTPAMHLGLMMDASGSMQADMKLAQRSEERRVGKECRAGCAPGQERRE